MGSNFRQSVGEPTRHEDNERLTAPSVAGAPHRPGCVMTWPDIALIFLLTFLPFLFFWRLITPNPADRMQIVSGDFTEQYFPLRAFAAQEWVNGRIPLWNPYLYGGQPALADIQSGALYPPHVIEALILGWGGPLFGREVGFPLWALELQVIVHFSLAAVGTYLFLRYVGRQSKMPLRRARFGGVIASLVFTYGGYLTGFPVQQLTILEVSAWLPWLLWGLSMANERMSKWANRQRVDSRALLFPFSFLRPTAWTALAFALAILAGHPQTVLYIFYLSLAYSLFLAIAPLLPCPPAPLLIQLRRFTLRLAPWLLTILLGAAIAAAQLLPTLEFIGLSLRDELSYQAVAAGLPLNELVSILYPGFFGGSPEYVGIVTLVLVALALILARPRRVIYFWTGASLVSLLLVFGGNTFLYPLFYLLAPGFEAVRQQERAFLVYSFSTAVLAGYGAMAAAGPLSKSARLRYTLFEHRLRLIGGVAFGLSGFFIYGSAAATARGDEVNLFFGVLRHHLLGFIFLGGTVLLLALRSHRWLRRWWGMGLVVLWLAFNLFTVNWRFNLTEPPHPPAFTPNGVVQFLQSSLPSGQVSQKTAGDQVEQVARVASGGLLPGGNSAASVYNLQDLTGNTPLQLAIVNTFLQQMPAWRMWQLMNVRYVVDNRDIASDGLSLVFSEKQLKVFEVGDPFPRAWLASNTEVIADEGQAIERLSADDFDLRRQAILASPLNLSLSEKNASTVSLTSFSPTRLTATLEASDNHLLVFSQIYYPGWQVKIDNRSTDLLRVNVVQQGVVVPAGRHTVELVFNPAGFRVGGIISVIALLSWGLMLIWGRRSS